MKNKLINKNIANVYDLSPLQKGILYNYFSDRNTNAYIVQNVFNITHDVNMDFMSMALKLLFNRYDILRTKILFEGLSNPIQVVIKDVEPELSHTSLLHSLYNEREKEYHKILSSEVERGFDLQKDLLLRVRIIFYNEAVTRIVFNYHHIILDGWSVSTIYATLLEYYDLLCENNSYEEILNRIGKEREQNTDYKDYIDWVTHRNQSKELEYWAGYLKDYEGTTDIIPISKHLYTGSETQCLEKISVSEKCSMKAFSFTETYNVTLNSLLMAVWGIYLQKVNYSNDVVFGKVVSGRNISENDVRGIMEIVGLLANTVPARVTCSKNTTFLELVRKINNESIEEGGHQCCSLAEIQALTKQKNGLIKTLYVLENFKLDTQAWIHKHMEIQAVSYREQTNYDISMILSVENNLLHAAIRYDPKVFSPKDVTKILQAFRRILSHAIDHPDFKVSDMPYVSNSDKQRILKQSRNTEQVSLENLSVVRMFEQCVRKKCDYPAVQCGNKTLSYHELNGYSNLVSKMLRLAGAKPDQLVPLLCKRGLELMIGILGTLKSGAAYIPLDIEQPEERIQYILKDSKCSIVLTDGSCENINFPENVEIIDLRKLWGTEGIKENPESIGNEKNLAYCIYTSGTSGVPKGVLIEKRSLTNYIYHACHNYINHAPVIPLFSNCAFDLTVTSIFLPVISGGEMVIYPGNVIDAITDIFNSSKYTLVKLTPAQLKIALSLEHTGQLSDLETLILGGEALETSDALECLSRFGNHIKIHNEYGPTEATVGCCDYVFDPIHDKEAMVSIGRPIFNTSIYVLKGNELCDIGIKGELCIAGSQIARGYVGDTDNNKFMSNPFGEGIMYRSGDIAKWDDNGNLTFMGRMDDQWNVRGYRIEPDEIISALKSVAFVTDAAVTLESDCSGNASIHAYYVSVQKLDVDEIRQLLSNKVPSYMLPSVLTQIDEIPLTPSGKIDRLALSKLKKKSFAIYETRDIFEQTVMSAWKKVLGIEEFSIHDNFFEIGGNSLLIMKMIYLISKNYPDLLKAGDVFANPTVHLLAGHLKQSQGGRISCERIVFPLTFFRNGRPVKLRRLSFTVKDHIAEAVIRKNDEGELFTMLLFSYCYALFEFIRIKAFAVCVRKENLYFVVRLNEEDFTDLNLLPQIIWDKYSVSEKYEMPVIRFGEKINGLFPIFTYNSDAPHDHGIVADFDFNVRVKKKDILLNVELYNKEISSESAAQFAEEFQSVLEEIYC